MSIMHDRDDPAPITSCARSTLEQRARSTLTAGVCGASAAVLLWLAGAGPSAAQNDVVVRLAPAEIVVPPGEEFEVSVAVEDVVDLAAFQFTLEYDDALLHVGGVSAGRFLGSTGRNVVPLGPVTDTGRITYGAYSEPGAPGPSGMGELAIVRLEAQLEEAETILRLVDVALSDSANNEIPVGRIIDARVLIATEPPPAFLYLPHLANQGPLIRLGLR